MHETLDDRMRHDSDYGLMEGEDCRVHLPRQLSAASEHIVDWRV